MCTQKGGVVLGSGTHSCAQEAQFQKNRAELIRHVRLGARQLTGVASGA
ncbi:MAG: hypothetical protein WAM86_17230 [Candidatus Sulfotelmatobacter sp.]